MKIIAHRGCSGNFPENTLVAFEQALRLKVAMIELDIHTTCDGKMVVIHDASVNRTSNGKGLIRNLSYDKLRKLDFGSWFHPRFINERIPLLEEILELSRGKTLVNIEIKSNPDCLPDVLHLLEKLKMLDQVILSSDVSSILRTFLPLIGKVRLAQIVSPKHLPPKPIAYPFPYIHPKINLITPAFVKFYHQKNIGIHVWTVNSVTTQKHLQRLGIDGIFTDFPEFFIN